MHAAGLDVYEVGHVLTVHSGWEAAKIAASLELLVEICGMPSKLAPADRQLAAELALAHGLTFYDASYVATARRLGRRVLTADTDLLKPGLAIGLREALA